MGSHFLTLHACGLEQIQALIGSKDAKLLAKIPTAARDEHADALRALLEQDFDAADPAALIRALEVFCKSAAMHSVTIEMYDDEDAAPLLWQLCWEGDEVIDLPLSDDGTPALTCLAPASVNARLQAFQQLQQSGGYEDRYLNKDDLERIVGALQVAEAGKLGMFGFVEY